MKKLLIILTAFISTLATAQTHYPIKNFLKVNCYSDNIVSHYSWSNFSVVTERKQKAIVSMGITGLRLSTDAYANKDDNNSLYWLSPDRRGFQMDTGIYLLKKLDPNISINICYQNQPNNIKGEWVGVPSTVYRHYGSDPNVSSTYSELAHDCGILTARGGRNINVQDYPVYFSPFWWEPRQTMYKGLKLYDIIEPGNEWDNQYSNYNPVTGLFENKPTYTGAQYAAAWSAVYDTVKKIDPTMLVSTTGIANGDPQIMIDALNWCKINRGGQLPFDKAQHHFYPWGWPWQGAIPGEYSITVEAKKILSVLGDVHLTAGEWSFDENPKSDIGVPAYDGYTSAQGVGRCAVRQILKFSQIGVYDAYYYRLFRDYVANIDSSAATFATSSLLKQTDDSCHVVRRTVGDYWAQISVFGDYAYLDSQRDDSVQVHRFTYGSKEVYPAWEIESISSYVDARGVTHPLWHERKYDYFFPSGTIYRLNDDSSGVLKSEKHAAGNVTLSASPIFFVPDPVNAPLPLKLISFTAQKTGQVAKITYVVQDAAKVEVEKSTDGRNWINLGEGILNKLVDMRPASGANYYRLKMYDQDGSFTYSFIRAVAITGVHAKAILFNVAGQAVKVGYSEDVEGWKSQLIPGKYFILYDNTYTEPYLKQ